MKTCQKQGWKARCLPIEVGCTGFAGQSLCKNLSALELKGEEPSRTTQGRHRKLQDGSGRREEVHGEQQIPPAPNLVLGCMFKDVEHLKTPGYITDDVFRSIQKVWSIKPGLLLFCVLLLWAVPFRGGDSQSVAFILTCPLHLLSHQLTTCPLP